MALWSLSSFQDVRANRRIDSEFFRPEYLAAERRARAGNVEDLGKLGRFVPGPFGSAFHVQNYDVESPYRYIRGMDVKPFFLLNEDNRYIPALDFYRLSQYEVRKDDLMISVVGTLGNVAVCTEQDVPAMFSCKSTLFRSIEADPYFLLAYLNSTPGQLCILRRQRGAIQTGLNIEDLKTIPIPRFGEALENELAKKVRSAYGHLLSSRDAYSTAQRLLDAELGFEKLTYYSPIGYVTQASDLATSRRSDAEFYNPAAREVVRRIRELEHTTVRESFYIKGGFPWNSVKFLADNSGEPVVRIRNIKPNHIVPEELTSIEPSYANSIGVMKAAKGDVVIGMDGIRYFYSSILEGECFVNQRVCHLSPRPSNAASAEYAVFIINSLVGQAQLMRSMTVATTVGHITNRDVGKLVIPTISPAFHDQVTELIRKSIDNKEESKRLLAQAKTRVNQLIEQAVQS